MMKPFRKTRPWSVWTVSLIAVGLLLLLSACGGDSAPAPEPEQPPAAAQTTDATEAAPEPATEASQPEGENAQDHVAASDAAYADGNMDQAIAELDQAIELDPTLAEAYRKRGLIYGEQGQDEKAKADFKKAIELAPEDPGNFEVYYNLALANAKTGDEESAIAAWTEAIALEPDNAEVYFNRGLSYFNLKAYDEAIADYTKTIELDPTHAQAYNKRGKTYAFGEKYEQAIADLTQAIQLDSSLDDAYFNRAVSTTKIGGTPADLAAIIADYGMVLEISENPELLQQAQKALETFLENSDDPALRQQVAQALGQTETSTESSGEEPSVMDLDINRPPGTSIGFENSLQPNEAHTFLVVASAGSTLGAGVTSTSPAMVGLQSITTGAMVASGQGSVFAKISENGPYQLVIQDVSGVGGPYTAAFEGSFGVSFELYPNFLTVGRLPQGGALSYTYSAPAGTTLQANLIPHPDTPVDLVVTIHNLADLNTTLLTVNSAGAGERERFDFVLPKDGTYIVTVEDANGAAGAYVIAAGAASQ